MLSQNFFFTLLLAAPAIAAPTGWNWPNPQNWRAPHTARSPQATTAADPVLPVQTPNSLPILSPTATLKVIALGVGSQNYTCKDTPNSNTSAPVSVGARADLYDVTDLFRNNPSLEDSETRAALVSNSGLGNNRIGQHFFTNVGSTLTPTFDLDAHDPPLFLSAVKSNTETAPKVAFQGLSSEGAIAWLFLGSDNSGLSQGVNGVYRVETAGGMQPATCADKSGDFQVPYSAEYWFYQS
ncbi:MAG: hypothetical protein M1820_009849 [Bogoriella megaspora]|nr:MAG: hypothetical protein M1820_009849 [Bogoriella megaspora]